MGTLKIAILEQDGVEYDVSTEMDLNNALAYVGATFSSSNDGMGARIIPSGTVMTIAANYESVITRRAYVNGRLVINGKLSVIF